jgi:hypothetical protein
MCIPLVGKRIENTCIDNDHADTTLSTEALTKDLIHSLGHIAAPAVPHPHEGRQWTWTLDGECVEVRCQPQQIFGLVIAKPVHQVVKLVLSSHTGKYRGKSPFRFAVVPRRSARAADMLAAQPTTLGEPYSRHLGGKLRELRFTLDGSAVRITYWLTPDRRIVLLTVFRKTRQGQTTEVERAHQAQKMCQTDHGPAEHSYNRIKEDRP